MADVTLQPRTPALGAAPLAVADGDLLMPLAGDWSAHLEFADLVTPPSGKVTLTWLGQTLQGYVLRSGDRSGRVFALIGGGEGGLGKPLPARENKNSTVREILQQVGGRLGILKEAGEVLSSASDPAVLGRVMPSWPRRADTSSALLDDLCRELGAVWRTQLDGSIWVGRDTFAPAVLKQELQVLDEADPAYATQMYIPHAFGPVPGQSLDGKPIGCAQYTISPDAAALRLWFLDAPSNDLDAGNLRRGFADIIREVLRLDFHASYPGKVVVQRGDGTLDIQLDSRALPPLTQVRYRALAPGARIVFDPGARVQVQFDNADPTKPVAGLADPGTAQRGVARINDPVGWLIVTTGPVGMGGATAVVSVAWSPTDPGVVVPPVVKIPLSITGAYSKVLLP